MSSLIAALDRHTPQQIGENGHTEYTWSNDTREKIVQFSFQVTRTDKKGVDKLRTVLVNLLTSLKHKLTCTIPEREVAKGYLSVLYKIIGHTRDIIDGKGEYTLSYMMIHTWYDFFPELAKFALRCLVDLGDKSTHQYGSWKDIKYFCDYCNNEKSTNKHPLINYAIELLNTQIRKDCHIYLSAPNDLTLAAKWAPREKSHFGWLFTDLAIHYFPEYMNTANNSIQENRAILKCKTMYRKLLSTLNRNLDTLQIKQCDNRWGEINFDNVTSISNTKQKKAFLNIKKDNSVRFPDNEDRKKCAENYKARIQKAVNGEGPEMKGARVAMAEFTSQARRFCTKEEIDLINSQWRDNSKQTGPLGKMVAMVDVSGSMEGDPMNVAIALGIRIAEKCSLGKRVMTFSSTPTWVNLEAYTDFVSMVQVVSRAPWGTNTNFYAALKLILDAIIENRMSPEDVQDMVLVILSDMQMDSGDGCDKKALYENITDLYAKAGVAVHGEPYKPPHILFWNLRSTDGFPCLSTMPNCSMMSGFSPALLNEFCEQGMEALQSVTPWFKLEQTLEKERYKILADKLDQEIEV